jgi:hypothetical protein
MARAELAQEGGQLVEAALRHGGLHACELVVGCSFGLGADCSLKVDGSCRSPTTKYTLGMAVLYIIICDFRAGDGACGVTQGVAESGWQPRTFGPPEGG